MTRNRATRAAEWYTEHALGRSARVAGVLLGINMQDALVLLRARDGEGDYGLHVLGDEVIDEFDADEYFSQGGKEDQR